MIIKNSRPLLCVFLISFSLLFPSVGDWHSLHSTISINDISISGNSLIMLSDQTISIHDMINDNIEFYSAIDGLETSDMHTIKCVGNKIWIGGVNGEVEVYDPTSKSSYLINHLGSSVNVNNIGNIEFFNNTMVSSYISDNRAGILLFDIDSSGYPDYSDYIDQFSDYYPSEINDIAVSDERIFIASDEGVFTSFLNSNLKLPDSWELVGPSPFIADEILILSEDLYAATNQSLFYFSDLSLSPSTVIDVSFADELVEIDASNVDNIYMLYKENLLHLELDNNVYMENQIWSANGSEYTSIDVSVDRVAVGLMNRGYMHIVNGSTDYFQNNTMALPSYSSITYLSDGSIAAAGYGGLIHYKNGIVVNMIPESQVEIYQFDNLSNSNLQLHSLDFQSGNFLPWSVVEYSTNKIMFSNSGIIPSNNTMGSVIALDLNNYELIDIYNSDNSTLDGMDGIYHEDWDANYMVVNQITLDNSDMVWVANPYAEANGNIFSKFNPSSGNWIGVDNNNNPLYMPQEVTFDSFGNAWAGFRRLYTLDNSTWSGPYSQGGVQKYSGGQWSSVPGDNLLPGGSEEDVWSLDFCNHDGVGILWIMTNDGVQGYTINEISNQLSPISSLDYFTEIPFFQGDHIRTDSECNVWVSTRHSGVRVILSSDQFTTYWPDYNGITEENSYLASDVVYDFSINGSTGEIAFTTSEGISFLETPFIDIQASSGSTPLILVDKNPFLVPRDEMVSISNIPVQSLVKIATLHGEIIKDFDSPVGTEILWDGKRNNGEYASSGVYLVCVYSDEYGNAIEKLAIVREK